MAENGRLYHHSFIIVCSVILNRLLINMDVNRIDDEYESKMVAFEIGCQDGKGEALACHQVGEYYSVVKDDHARAAKTYQLNCDRGYGPSCFNLGRLFRKLF